MSEKEVTSLQRVIFFEGSFFFSSRPIPGLENLPLDLVGSKSSSDSAASELPVMENGDCMIVTNWSAFSAPKMLLSGTNAVAAPTAGTVSMDRRCADCTKAFVDLNGLKTHCSTTGHQPQMEQTGLKPSNLEVFTSFCNCALQRAMGERMAKWGREYIDPKSFTEPQDRQGRSMGVRIFRAFSCEFGVHKPHGQNMSLTLTVDLRAKVIRTRNLLHQICEDKDPNKARFNQRDIQRAQRQFKGEVVIRNLLHQICEDKDPNKAR